MIYLNTYQRNEFKESLLINIKLLTLIWIHKVNIYKWMNIAFSQDSFKNLV